MNFYDNYEKLCIERGLKPQGKEMIDYLGVHSSTVSAWKKGFTPRIELLCKIADYFNVSIDFLLGRTDVRSIATEHPENTDASAHADNAARGVSESVSSRGQNLPGSSDEVIFFDHPTIEAYNPAIHKIKQLVRLCIYHNVLMCYDPDSRKIIEVPADFFSSTKTPETVQKPSVNQKKNSAGIISTRITEDEQFLIDVYRKVNAEGRARINQAVMNIYDEYTSTQPKEKANASAS